MAGQQTITRRIPWIDIAKALDVPLYKLVVFKE